MYSGADQKATVNVKLELGATSETVSIVAESIQVDTSTSTMRQVVDERRIIELPLNGRNAATLTLLVPGAVTAPSAGADQGQTRRFPAQSPSRPTARANSQISYRLDGGNNVDEYTNVNAPFPFPDALQEFSVQTSNYSAEYGQNSGGVVNIITKSGTNDLHGDGFGFVRNAVFNARNFFAATRDQLKRGQFGGVIGGPVYIPGVYNGKDRTFFFFGYQGTTIRNLQGSAERFCADAGQSRRRFLGAAGRRESGQSPEAGRRRSSIRSPGQPFPGNRIPDFPFRSGRAGGAEVSAPGRRRRIRLLREADRPEFHEEVAKVDHSFGARTG